MAEIHVERKRDDKCFVADYRPFMKLHDWRERTDTGENRLWRATKHGGRWAFMSRLQRSEDDWTRHETMRVEDLRQLREVLFNKYQRRRLPWEDVVTIDQMIEEAEQGGGEFVAGGDRQGPSPGAAR